jgi:hypothetical protein
LIGAFLVLLQFSPPSLAGLTSLDLTGNDLDNASWQRMRGLRWLRELILTGNQLRRLPDVSDLPRLLRLDVAYNPLGAVRAGDLAVHLGATLRDLNLEGTQLTTLHDPEGGAWALQALTSLVSLNISANRFAEAGPTLRPLQTGALPRLAHLVAAPNLFCSGDPAYPAEIVRTAKSLACLRTLNQVRRLGRVLCAYDGN